MIEIVSATRLSEGEFWQKAALGLSLKRLAEAGERLVAHITYENKTGLSELFNARITAADGGDILAFIHDDVWIDDYFFSDRVLAGLRQYDVIGVAGATRLVPGQVGWTLPDDRVTNDSLANMSGRVAHGPYPFAPVHDFGPVPAGCELLDGLFLAARRATLCAHDALFDPRFDFHFYDVDFCRTARMKGLRLGTWPICLTHQSGGMFDSPAWREKLALYRAKWSV